MGSTAGIPLWAGEGVETCFSPLPGDLVVSVVSHGHGPLVQRLLDDLARLSSATARRVVLTLNVPEAPPLAPRRWLAFCAADSRQCPACGLWHKPQSGAGRSDRALRLCAEPGYHAGLRPPLCRAGATGSGAGHWLCLPGADRCPGPPARQ